jgi:hypothetical protein
VVVRLQEIRVNNHFESEGCSGFRLGECGGKGSATNYNEPVARGWESKSVEAQQAEANDKPTRSQSPMSAEEAARWREKESLRLSRQRVLQQMQVTQNPRHRKLLEDSLADLDQKLSRLAT